MTSMSPLWRLISADRSAPVLLAWYGSACLFDLQDLNALLIWNLFYEYYNYYALLQLINRIISIRSCFSAYGKAITPAQNTIYARPSYIILEAESDTAYAFLYETTCSIGGTTGETHTQGYMFSAHGEKSSVKLDIQPVSWNGGDGAVGEITFVYKGGR